MPNVFLSYARKNMSSALHIKEKLQNEGISEIFMDIDPEDGLRPGSKWEQQLRLKITESKAVFILFSKDWSESANCCQEYSWAIAAHEACEAEAGGLPRIMPLVFHDRAFEELKESPHEKLFDFNGFRLGPALSSTEASSNDAELEELWTWLRAELETVRVCSTRPAYKPERGPYRGLEALQELDAAVYFGRETLAEETLAQLFKMKEPGGKKLLTILAASGAGKSSLLRAGLIHRINYQAEDFYCLPVFRPGNAALTEVSEGLVATISRALRPKQPGFPTRSMDMVKTVVLEAAEEAEATNVAVPADDLTALGRLEKLLIALQDHVSPRDLHQNIVDRVTLVLPVDQAEELLPLSAEGRLADENRNAEALKVRALLAALLQRRLVDLVVIMALRSDSFHRLQIDERLGQFEREIIDLPPLPQASYRSVIKEPARVAGIKIEEALVEALLRDVEGLGDALPLLAFVLQRILKRAQDARGTKAIILKLEDYEKLTSENLDAPRSGSRIGLAIDLVVKEALGENFDESLLRQAFIPHLALVNEQDGTFLRRPADRGEIPQAALPMIEKLVAARILVATAAAAPRATAGNGPTSSGKIEVAHEAVLRQWMLLRGWLDDAKNALGLLNTAESDSERWQRDRKDRNLVEQYSLDKERLYTQERLNLVYDALDSLGLFQPEFASKHGTRLSKLREFIRPEYVRLIQELNAEYETSINGGPPSPICVANHPRRFQIGNRLDEIGDPRPGVSVFSEAFLKKELQRIELHKKLGLDIDATREAQLCHISGRRTSTWDAIPDIVWCEVQPGEVELRLETDGEGNPNRSVTRRTIDAPFWISKYPLTIEQFYAFACPRDEESGEFLRDNKSSHYQEPAWWQGFPGVFANPFKSSVNERDPQRNFPAQFVNWFQAVAYSRWLTDSYRRLGLLSDEGCVRLPMEWEWQQAATGGDNTRFYPWGNEWRNNYCRNREGQDSACSVGLYPLGNSPIGAVDMSGLIVEWCFNSYDEIDNCDLTADVPRATRGGAYFTFTRKELPDYKPEFAVSVHGRLKDNPSGILDDGRLIRTGVRLICTGLNTSAAAIAFEKR